MLEFFDKIEDCGLLDELAYRVDVEEDAVAEQTRCGEVPRPHFELVLRNLAFVCLDEVLRQSADLLVILSRQGTLYKYV